MTVARVEAHAHVEPYGQALSMPSAATCESVDSVLSLVASSCAGAPAGSWVRIVDARIEGWAEHRWPTLAELDAASGETPCVLLSFDRHSAMANTRAIERSGANVRHSPLAIIEEDAITGVLLESLAYEVWGAAPPDPPEARESNVLRALERFASLGYSAVHDMYSHDWLGPLLGGLDRAGRLPTAVRLYAPVDELEAVASGRDAWETDRVRLAGGKVFTDGALNSRTALMLSEYAQPLPGLPNGKAMVRESDLDDAFGLAGGLGLPLALHAIGDGAVRMVLDGAERASRAGHLVRGTRIEHCELVDASDVGRFASLGVVCSVQPCHLLADMEVLGRLLSHRLDRVLPLRELIDAGVRPGELLVFGSDAPIVRPDPEDSIIAAVERRRPEMASHHAIASAQAITESEAWAAFGPSSVLEDVR